MIELLNRKNKIDTLTLFLPEEGARIDELDLELETRDLLKSHLESTGFQGKRDELFLIPLKNNRFSYLCLVGLGRRSQMTLDAFNQRVITWFDGLPRRCRSKIAIVMSGSLKRVTKRDLSEVLLFHLAKVAYSYRDYMKEKRSKPVRFYVVADNSESRKCWKELAERVTLLQKGDDFTRDLANAPANALPPQLFASKVTEVASSLGWSCEIWDEERLERESMTGILHVGRAASHPPRLLHAVLNPEGEKRLVLIGKGVIFDSGGVSLKPPGGMEEMKYDKCGAAAVAGMVPVLPKLKLSSRIDLLIPLVENLPGSKSVLPGDILSFRDNTSVEVVNTDAEGRLILADCLILAREWKADLAVDLATLTGACHVALGSHAAALFSNRTRLSTMVERLASSTGEWVWPMPLWFEYAKELKGGHAALKNIGSRWGGAIHAAKFLEHFIGRTPWCHLDIAGVSYTSHNRGRHGGANGWGVALLARIAEEFDNGNL